MSIQDQISNDKCQKRYDLVERTAKFGEDVIEFVRSLPTTSANKILGNQLIRSATSIGANYMDADAAESKKDFQHKIALCKKESKESMHWSRMLAKANPNQKEHCQKIYQEAHELTLIFSKIIISSKKSQN